MRVAVLGVGNMGRAFARRALDKGHDVTVWNRSPDAATELVSDGATRADTIAEAAATVEVVLVVVADDAAAAAVCLGEDGALAALPDDGVLVNVTTMSPEGARRLAAAGPAGRVLDAPVLGAPALVAAGGAHFLIGGDQQRTARLDPLWADLSAGYVFCGAPGTGATMKLMSNLALIVGISALAESIAIARGHDISDDLLREVFAHSPVISGAAQVRLDSLLSADHPGWFPPTLARKDVQLALDLAERAGVPVAIAPATAALLTTVIEAGEAWPDFTAVIEALT